MKQLVRKIFLWSILPTLCVLLLLEVGVRVLYRNPPPPEYTVKLRHSDGGGVSRISFNTANSTVSGGRNIWCKGGPVSAFHPDGLVRIVTLGGSTTHEVYHPCKKTYSHQIERILQKHYPSADVQVLNLGESGQNTTFVKDVVETLILSELLPTDIVVIHSVYNQLVMPFVKRTEKTKLNYKEMPLTEFLNSVLMTHSAFYVRLREFIVYRFNGDINNLYKKMKMKPYKTTYPVFTYHAKTFEDQVRIFHEKVDEHEKILRQIVRRLKSKGIGVVLVKPPIDHLTKSSGPFDKNPYTYNLEGTFPILNFASARMNELAREEGIAMADANMEFRLRAGDDWSHLFFDIVHTNVDGSLMLAQIISSTIIETPSLLDRFVRHQ